jgi:hypothetical protein
MRKLAVDARGYPVPWFVEWFHADGKPREHVNQAIRPGDYPDFRVVDSRKMTIAYREKLCWVCGERLGKHLAFVAGPMCAVNRTSGEPPSHRDCAIYSAMACPFLTKPEVERRENKLPEGVYKHPEHLDRNPGVVMVWMTTGYYPQINGRNLTFRMGPADEVLFFCQGRPATREEVMHSIDTGMPFLREAAEKDGARSLEQLSKQYAEMLQLVPAA